MTTEIHIFKRQLQITLNNTKEHSHYSNTQLPATVKNNNNSTNWHVVYSNNQHSPELKLTLNNTNKFNHYSNSQILATFTSKIK